MKKIGLCMTFKGTNYGQLLQSYALQQIIDILGYETEIIDYCSGNDKGVKISYASIYVMLKQMKNKISKYCKKNKEHFDDEHLKNIETRNKVSNKFRKNRLHNKVKCNGIHELKEISKKYKAVVVGSDQIWAPEVAVTNFYTLRFAAPGVTRVSYATSMGVSSYPNYAKKPAAEFWKKIDFLSVREQQAKEIIYSISGMNAKVVADPTYLLTPEEWLERIPNKEIVEKGYILCYFLGDSAPIKEYAKKFSKSKGLRLVSILSNECNSDDHKFCDEVTIGKSPEDFINLIRNAEFVLTDSFHGLAFSVINEKQFLIFYRNRTDVKESRNSRIDNIVKTWGVEDRLIKNPQETPIPTTSIDYTVVSKKREKFRKESLDFLKNALNNRK